MKAILIILLALIFTSCSNFNNNFKKNTNEENEKKLNVNPVHREFYVNVNSDTKYEEIVIENLSININGNYTDMNNLFFEKFDDVIISNSLKHFDNGYGAKEISIDYIKTYDTLEELEKDEELISSELEDVYNKYENSKVVFVIFNYFNTDKSIRDRVMLNIQGANSQYFVVSQLNDEYLIVYQEFLGN